MKLSDDEQKRWIETMPILAAIRREPPPKARFMRSTEWGDLWLKGEHYTLVRKA